VLLDGLGGDAVVSRGRARYDELLLHGRLRALTHELRAAARHDPGSSAARLFLRYAALPLLPWRTIDWWQRARGVPRSSEIPAFLRPRIRALVNRERPPGVYSTRQEHLAQLTAPLAADGLELFDRVMALNGAEARYPFFDRRLAEYCVSLPGDQKLAGGFSRIVARRGMAGIVPDAVRWRVGKGAPGLHVIPALRGGRAMMDDLFVRDPSALEPYVEIDALRREYDAFMADRRPPFHRAVQLWSAAALGLWFRRRSSGLIC
jgi:asparagine synthase (glutamine-hydrolysing)